MKTFFIDTIEVTDLIKKIQTKTNMVSPETSRVSTFNNRIEIVQLNRSKRNDLIRISKFENLIIVENRYFIERFIPPIQKENLQFIEFYKIPKNKIVTKDNLIILCYKKENKQLIVCRNSVNFLCELSEGNNEFFISFHKNGNSKYTFDSSIQEGIKSWINPDREYSIEEFFNSLNRAKFAYFGNPTLSSIKILQELKTLVNSRHR